MLDLQLVQTELSPSTAMAHWLSTREAPYHFTIDRDCELKTPDDEKSSVRYARHTLDIDEVAQHIAADATDDLAGSDIQACPPRQDFKPYVPKAPCAYRNPGPLREGGPLVQGMKVAIAATTAPQNPATR